MLRKKELIKTIEILYNERQLDPADVLHAIESSIAKTARMQYGSAGLLSKVCMKSGSIFLYHVLNVVEQAQDKTEISLSKARDLYTDVEIGDIIVEELPFDPDTRSVAHAMKHELMKNIAILERRKVYKKHREHLGQIVEGIVTNVQNSGITIQTEQGRLLIPRNEIAPRERFNVDQRVKACIIAKQNEEGTEEIIGSRASKEFLMALLRNTVPEIEDGTIVIKNVARMAGFKSKVAVYSNDHNMYPVGICIGIGGTRIKSIREEITDEVIDIVEWTDNKSDLIKIGFNNIEVQSIQCHGNNAIVCVDPNQIRAACGFKGKNIRLLSEFVGLNISVVKSKDEMQEKQNMHSDLVKDIMEAIEVNDIIAMILVSSGYDSVTKIVKTPIDHIVAETNMEQDLVNEIHRRATLVHSSSLAEQA